MFIFSHQTDSAVETLQEFKTRTSYVYAPFSSDAITLNPNCWKKVNERGEFKSFYGDTLVYLLDDNVKKTCKYLQNELYKHCSDAFAEPLSEDTFHLTLHDLNNNENAYLVYPFMEETEIKVRKAMSLLLRDKTVIHLKSTRIINMVNTSLVLCFEPETEEDCQTLMNYYELFQQIVPLSYPLTPHITLAYFNAAFDSFDEHFNFRKSYISKEYADKLKTVIDTLNQMESIHLELSVFDLAYQHFSSMNHYTTKFQLNESILIADDAAFMRAMMHDALKDLPVHQYDADSVEQLIQKIEEVYPSVILLDNSLPGADCHEVLQMIHEIHPGAAVIYLALTPICQTKIISSGASGYLSKPLNKDLLKEEVLKHLHHIKEGIK